MNSRQIAALVMNKVLCQLNMTTADLRGSTKTMSIFPSDGDNIYMIEIAFDLDLRFKRLGRIGDYLLCGNICDPELLCSLENMINEIFLANKGTNV